MLRRRILFSLVALCFLPLRAPAQAQSSGDAVRARGTLIAGVRFDTPPFGFIDASGKNVGIDIEIAQHIARRLGVKLELMQVTGQSRIPTLNSGKVDMLVAALTRTEERAKAIDFTVTYINDAIGILVKKGTQINNVGDLRGKTISTVQGNTVGPAVKRLAPE